jgi:hypothetical protein
MGTNMKVGAAALLSLMTTSQAFAGWFPTPPTPAAVPEFDGPSGIAAIALLVSVAAIFFSRSRNN